jgi:hypothetical protein
MCLGTRMYSEATKALEASAQKATAVVTGTGSCRQAGMMAVMMRLTCLRCVSEKSSVVTVDSVWIRSTQGQLSRPGRGPTAIGLLLLVRLQDSSAHAVDLMPALFVDQQQQERTFNARHQAPLCPCCCASFWMQPARPCLLCHRCCVPGHLVIVCRWYYNSLSCHRLMCKIQGQTGCIQRLDIHESTSSCSTCSFPLVCNSDNSDNSGNNSIDEKIGM